MTRASAVVECRGVRKAYGKEPVVEALKGVDVSVARDEFVAVMGPSGSGKTTLLNLVGTLDRPTSGEIFVDGEDVLELKQDALADFRRETIGFVFQLFNLVPTLSAIENVILPLLPYRRGLGFDLRERGRGLLEGVGLADRADHLPGELSGGEQQRVAVARALINRPKLVLADEPTGNLDTKAGDDVMQLLGSLRAERGLSLIVATHSPRVAAFAERAYFLKDGAVVDEAELGSADQAAKSWMDLGFGPLHGLLDGV